MKQATELKGKVTWIKRKEKQFGAVVVGEHSGVAPCNLDRLFSATELSDLEWKNLVVGREFVIKNEKIEIKAPPPNLVLLGLQKDLGDRFKEAVLMVDGSILDMWNEGNWAIVEVIDKTYHVRTKLKSKDKHTDHIFTTKQKVSEAVTKVLLGE